MNADVSSLPVRDFLDMGVAMAGVQIVRFPTPAYHVFFRLRMHNASGSSIQLLGRKWLLKDASGATRIIEAAKVFNQTPVLATGAVFSYGGRQTFTRPPVHMEVRFFGSDQRHEPFMTPPLAFPSQCFKLPSR